MLKIFNDLKPFFEDCYRRINIREYAKLVSISPPTASTILNNYARSNLLLREKDRNYLFFHANTKDKQFIELSRIYWANKLSGFLEYLEKELVSPTIILFGSLSKAETKNDSDIDIAILANKKNINVKNFEEKLGRNFQIFWFRSINDIKSKELANNILNGFILKGRLFI